MKKSTIVSVTAMEGFADNGQTAILTSVRTKDGSVGNASCCADLFTGKNEPAYLFDGGERFDGMGVTKAVEQINQLIAPKLIGQDALQQAVCDEILLSMDREKLGTNTIAAVSCAVLKAAAASTGTALYQQLGGARAFTLPLPAYLAASGSNRYGEPENAGYSPSFYFLAYDFATYQEATTALWEVLMNWEDDLRDFLGVKMTYTTGIAIPKGKLTDDFQLCDRMNKVIQDSGYAGKVGIQIDLSAGAFWNPDTARYEGLFSTPPKTREEMIELAVKLATDYPVMILEDPLAEDDFEGFAEITRRTDIQILGSRLYAGNLKRIQKGIAMGAGNAVKIDVAQIGTVTETAQVAQYAYEQGFGLYGGAERGEAWDSCDYAVGLNCLTAQNMGLGFAGNRLLQIESELGGRAKFSGKRSIRGRRFQIR